MDGIFGVGLPEMIIIALVLFVIGGPENTAKWARQAGRMVRELRGAWDEFMKDIETELGPDGKELIDATRELGQNAAEFRRMSSPRRLMSDTTRYMDNLGREIDDDIKGKTSATKKTNGANGAANPAAEKAADSAAEPGPPAEPDERYRAWTPQKQDEGE